MKNFLVKSNQWFDNLKEPYRFLTFFFGVALPIGIGNAMMNHGYFWVSPVLILVFCGWRMSPIFFKTQKKKVLTKAETLLLKSVEEINHLKHTYKDKGHAEKFLKDVEDYFKK